jgi:hypothetical protein
MLSGKLACRWIWAFLPVATLGLTLSVRAQPPAPSAAPGASGYSPLRYPEPEEGGPLRRPVESAPAPLPPEKGPDLYGPSEPFQIPNGSPSGFTGPSGVAPTVFQADGHFVPVEDRWRLGFPSWDRYDKGHPPLDDYPYDEGSCLNPYKQNVLKGDYPIIGQNTFFELTATSFNLLEARDIPTATTPFESTKNPNQTEFFGKPNQLVNQEIVSLSLDLFHGDAAFKPADWRIVVVPTFSASNLNVSEVAVVSPDVRKGTQRERTYFTLQTWFVEKKIADLSPNYDFVSIRAGSQPFNSDFRGFIFNDTNRAVRIFGTLESNRDQFNLVYFNQLEKDTNTQLNSINDNRSQHILIGNFYRQDFIWPGYTIQGSVHYNHDNPTIKFDKNGFLVRPDPVGTFQPHTLDVVYLGFAGDGHINRFNINHAFYWAVGHDSHNPLANQPQDISAQMAAIELSYDRDYVRFRSSYFFASGDGNPNNRHATGFDSIFDNPNFAGTQFSWFLRQNIPLFGVNLKQRLSIIPDLRSSKIQGQSNFVNPGIHLYNLLGVDVDVTPKCKLITNANLLWFDKTAPLETFVFQGNIARFIGADLNAGLEYRPLLSQNVVMLFGFGTLIPGKGFDDLYSRLNHTADAFLSGFAQLTLQY